MKTKLVKMTAKFKNFILSEKSAKGQAEEGWGVFQNFILGLGILAIALPAMSLIYNIIMNNTADGVNGDIDQAGLKQWADETSGFNRK